MQSFENVISDTLSDADSGDEILEILVPSVPRPRPPTLLPRRVSHSQRPVVTVQPPEITDVQIVDQSVSWLNQIDLCCANN